MRLDKFLKVTRIVKRRTLARELCDDEAVTVNDTVAKAGRMVHVNDRVTVRTRRQILQLTVLAVPERGVRKTDAADLYRVEKVEAVVEEW
jgi:ribosomal 50S subunit-recycling heat shock protein